MNTKISLGLEEVLKQKPKWLNEGFGLLANWSSITSDFRYSWDALDEVSGGNLKALFSPQHGLWGEQQANMIETPDSSTYVGGRRVSVHSLYSNVRKPDRYMFEGIQTLVIDLQDVGTRVYTFIWTMLYCLEAGAEFGIKVVVLDRPNPIGGTEFHGPELSLEYKSFVGLHNIPMRHGMTIGELALLFKQERKINVDLEVVAMNGWRRNMHFSQLDQRPWVPTSPNVPTAETCLYYVGTVLLEGMNLSEGRGTTIPFKVLGAPYLYPEDFANDLSALELPGVKFLPIKFIPTFDKWKGQSVGGVIMKCTDSTQFDPYLTTVAAIACAKYRAPNEFAWLSPPYEYETEKMPIDILHGSSKMREYIDSIDEKAPKLSDIRAVSKVDLASWRGRMANFLLYR
jgi:uncharacterized protein YbbC (DUF1343 family)